MMKNLVKKAKRKRWIAILLAMLFGIITYYVVFHVDTTHQHSVVIYIIKALLIIYAVFISFVSFYSIIFKKAYSEKNKISGDRKIHHLRLIEHAIDNNRKEDAELLLIQFTNNKNITQYNKIVSHLSGAIRAKFYNKLELI